jgi:hypothetical protein
VLERSLEPLTLLFLAGHHAPINSDSRGSGSRLSQ